MEEKVLELVREYSQHEIPDDIDTELLDSALIDSFVLINLVSVFEDEFDIELDSEDINKFNFSSVTNMIEMIKKHLR